MLGDKFIYTYPLEYLMIDVYTRRIVDRRSVFLNRNTSSYTQPKRDQLRDLHIYLHHYIPLSVFLLGITDRGYLYYDYRRNYVFISDEKLLFRGGTSTHPIHFTTNGNLSCAKAFKSGYSKEFEAGCHNSISVEMEAETRGQTILKGLKAYSPDGTVPVTIIAALLYTAETPILFKQGELTFDLVDLLVLCGNRLLIVKPAELDKLFDTGRLSLHQEIGEYQGIKRPIIPLLQLGFFPEGQKPKLYFNEGVEADFTGVTSFNCAEAPDVTPHKITGTSSLEHILKAKYQFAVCYKELDLGKSKLSETDMYNLCISDVLRGVTHITYPKHLRRLYPKDIDNTGNELVPDDQPHSMRYYYRNFRYTDDQFTQSHIHTLILPEALEGYLPNLDGLCCTKFIVPKGICEIALDNLPKALENGTSTLIIEGTPSLRFSSIAYIYFEHLKCNKEFFIKAFLTQDNYAEAARVLRYVEKINNVSLANLVSECDAYALLAGIPSKGLQGALEHQQAALIQKLFKK